MSRPGAPPADPPAEAGGAGAHYLDDHQLQGSALDGDSVFFVRQPARWCHPGGRRPCGPRARAFGARRAWGTFRLSPRLSPGARRPGRRPARRSRRRSTTSTPPTASTLAELAVRAGGRSTGAVAPNHLVTGLQRHIGWPDGDPEPAPRRAAAAPFAAPGRRGPGVDGSDHRHRAGRAGCRRTSTGSARRCTTSRHPGEVDETWDRPLHHIDHLDDDRDGYLDVEAGTASSWPA